MLLVILGAGASYDSVPARPIPGDDGVRYRDKEKEVFRPPLANALFASSAVNEQLLETYDLVGDINDQLQRRKRGESVEDVLFRLQAESAHYPRGRQQLMAARLYLRELIYRCEQGWARTGGLPTNHRTLMNRIHRWSGERVDSSMFVTFNYDCLIEESLSRFGFGISSMNDYVAEGRPRLFKLHGSIDWVRPLKQKQEDVLTVDTAAAKFLIRQAADGFDLCDIERAVDLKLLGFDGRAAVPALALPQHGKAFECPDSHLAELRRLLPRVRGVISIGWQGNEEHFLRELQLIPPAKVIVHAVSGNTHASEGTIQTLARLGFSPSSRPLPFSGGFSDYVRSSEMEELLERTLRRDAES